MPVRNEPKDLPSTIELVKILIICESRKCGRELFKKGTPLTLIETGNGLKWTEANEVANVAGGEIGSGCSGIKLSGDRGGVDRFPRGCLSLPVTCGGALGIIEGIVRL